MIFKQIKISDFLIAHSRNKNGGNEVSCPLKSVKNIVFAPGSIFNCFTALGKAVVSVGPLCHLNWGVPLGGWIHSPLRSEE